VNYSVVCPANSYCGSGVSEPTQCPVFSTSVLKSNSSSACLCNDGYYMDIGKLKCVQCGYGTYATRGSVNQCIQCPPWSNHSLLGSFLKTDCMCSPGFVGNAAANKSTAPISLIKSCNGSTCPATALSVLSSGQHAANALDGNPNTWYDSQRTEAFNDYYSWWRIDFRVQRQITSGSIWGLYPHFDRLEHFQVWIGDDETFPGANRLVYVSPSIAVSFEVFTCNDKGRYLYIARHAINSYFSFVDVDFVYIPSLCTKCNRDSYCPGGNSDSSIVCPNSTYSLYGSSSVSQCGCPVNSMLVQNRGCVCVDGMTRTDNPKLLFADWQCDQCPARSYCVSGAVTVCPQNTYCPLGSAAPIQCPALSTSSANSSSFADCLCPSGYTMTGGVCVICNTGTHSSRGATGSCTVCPTHSNTTSVGSVTAAECLCVAGYVGDVTTPRTQVEHSIVKSCNGLKCPVTALNSADEYTRPENAVDGYTFYMWHSKDISVGGIGYNWWRIDFQTTRWISRGWIHNTQRIGKLAGFQIWIGSDPIFPGQNTLIYASKSPSSITAEDFPVLGYGRYLYAANTIPLFIIDEIDIFTDDPPQCFECSRDHYCPGNRSNYTIECPNSTYSLPGASSVSQCACPANAALLPERNCTCYDGYYKVFNASAPLGQWQCSLCPKGSNCSLNLLTPCPPGYFCPNTGMTTPIICPRGSFCPESSITATTCPAESYTPTTGFASCLQCTACQIGSFQNTPCTSTQNRACTLCTAAKPLHAIFATTSPSCPWVCDNGYWGSNCEPCPPNYWCRFGVQNRCPLNSVSPELSGSQSGCMCSLGYMSTGKITGTSPCVRCPAGVLCNGVPVKEVEISVKPLVNVTTQVLLAQKPLPPASSMVSLFESIPITIASIRATLPNKNATVYLRQVCRRTYCVACDESSATACIRYITVGMGVVVGDGGGWIYSANTTSLRRDVMYFFVASSSPASGCVPHITGLSPEFVSDSTVVVISSVANVSSVRVECLSNSTIFVDLPVDVI